jgi:hypothetical protein
VEGFLNRPSRDADDVSFEGETIWVVLFGAFSRGAFLGTYFGGSMAALEAEPIWSLSFIGGGLGDGLGSLISSSSLATRRRRFFWGVLTSVFTSGGFDEEVTLN